MRESFSVFLLILGIAFSVFCKDYYVDVSGDPLDIFNDGSLEHPWASITSALSLVEGTESDPAVIHVAAGTYNSAEGERFPLEMKNYITLIGEGPRSTIIDVEGQDASAIYCNNIEGSIIDGFYLTGGLGTTGTRG